MSPEVSKTIHKTSAVTGIVAIILSPIPLADELVFGPVYAFMTTRIATHHALKRSDIPWKPIAATIVAALAARAALNVAVAYIPGVAAAANAVTAVAVTELLGQYVDTTCADPASARKLSVKEIAETLRKQVADRMPKKTAAPTAA
jgi:uncharacterized protein (DUF697 family)